MNKALATKIRNRHGLNIAVLIEIPENPRGLVFIMHGFTSSYDRPSSHALAEASLANHLLTVRFDATHSCGQSDGSVDQATVTTFLHDLNDVILWAATQDWYRAPYFLVGNSMGGLAALCHTQAYPDRVKAIAVIAPVISGQLSLQNYEHNNPGGTRRWQETGFREYACSCCPNGIVQLPWAYLQDRLTYDALAFAPGLAMPLFICVGSEDTSCPPAHQQLLFNAWGGQDKELHIIEGAPHTYRTATDIAALKSRFGDWLGQL